MSSKKPSADSDGALSTGLSWPVLGAIAAGAVVGMAIVIWIVLRTCRKPPSGKDAAERNLEAASESQQNLAHPLESYAPPAVDSDLKDEFPAVTDGPEKAQPADQDEAQRVTSLGRSASTNSDTVSHDSQGMPRRKRRPTMSTFGGRNISIIPVISEVPDVDINSSDDDGDDHDPENFLFIPAPTEADLMPDPTPPQPSANVPFAHRAWATGSNMGTPALSPAPAHSGSHYAASGVNSPAPTSSMFSSAPLATPLTASTLEALRVHANVAQSAARDPALKTPPLAMAMLHGPSDVYRAHNRQAGTHPDDDEDNGPLTPGIDAVLNRIISSAKPEELRRSLVFGPNDRVPGLAAPKPVETAASAGAASASHQQSKPSHTSPLASHAPTSPGAESYEEVVIVGEEERSIVQPATPMGETSVSLARSGSVSSQVHPDIVKSSLPRPPKADALSVASSEPMGTAEQELDLVAQQLAAETAAVPLEAHPIQVVSPVAPEQSAASASLDASATFGSDSSGTMRARPPTMIALPESDVDEPSDLDDDDDDNQPIGFSIHPAPVVRTATPVIVHSPNPSMVPLPAGESDPSSGATTPEEMSRNA